MTDLASLLSCLYRTPEDEVLWLAVADRLEEQGEDGRAELLRLCRRLRTMDQSSGPTLRWVPAEDRIRELIAAGVRPCVPEITNGIGMRLVLIPAGTFWIGSPESEGRRRDNEGPRHRVTLTRAFWMGVCPVTQAQYEAMVGVNPSEFSKTGEENARVEGLDTGAFPVENVSWADAAAFCEKLSALPEEIARGLVYRLPTEAEWEYACRGGLASGAFCFGDTLDTLWANYEVSGLGRTCPVGSYPPNAFGLHDMHGNIWEWCADWHAPYPVGPVSDPTGPPEGTERVARGGSFCERPEFCRSACRDDYSPEDGGGVGFRVVLTLSGP